MILLLSRLMTYVAFFIVAVFFSADVEAINLLNNSQPLEHQSSSTSSLLQNNIQQFKEAVKKGACGPGCRRRRNRQKRASREGKAAVNEAVAFAAEAKKAEESAKKSEEKAKQAQRDAEVSKNAAVLAARLAQQAADEGNFEAARKYAAEAKAHEADAASSVKEAEKAKAAAEKSAKKASNAASNASASMQIAKDKAKDSGKYASRIDFTAAQNAVDSANQSAAAANNSVNESAKSIDKATDSKNAAAAANAPVDQYINDAVVAKDIKDRSDNLNAMSKESALKKNDGIDLKPPPGDLSIIFLGNMFGVVDGVLAGTGSQITAQMFGVFNSAVLVLAGIIVSYTLLVATLNSAQEGQFIGQKWSSVWVPTRSITGAMLILPKASGYCTMQIFIMWVVVQGVGAADKVWSQALAYLNRGGAIVRPNVDPITGMNNGGNSDIFNGAYGMFVGQICMTALEQSMAGYRDSIKNQNICTLAETNSDRDIFCKTPVPNFINTVDFLTSENLSVKSPIIPMPNFKTSPYSALNGMCGSIKYNNFSLGDDVALTKPDPNVNRSAAEQQRLDNQVAYEDSNYAKMGIGRSEVKTLNSSRAVALHQMYLYLSAVSNKVISNVPFLSGFDCTAPDVTCAGISSMQNGQITQNVYYAEIDLGLPRTIDLKNCVAAKNIYSNGSLSYKDDACLSWDSPNGLSTILLEGPEIQDAVSTYNGMMTASLYIKSQLKDTSNYKKQRAFITDAEQTGWILAGAYYFRLAILTSQVLESSDGTVINDPYSGLGICTPGSSTNCNAGSWSITDFANGFAPGYSICSSDSSDIKNLFCDVDYITDMVTKINILINNDNGSYPTIPEVKANTIQATTVTNTSYGNANTAYGFLVNSSAIALPGQPGSNQPEFVMKTTFNATTNVPKLGNSTIRGGQWNIPGQAITFIFNNILKTFFNMMFSLVMPMINMMFFMFLQPPLILLSSIFLGAMEVLKNVNINPILGLTNMGVGLIEGAASSFILMLSVAVTALLFPGALGLLMMLLPVVVLWLGIMVSVGTMATYYLPFVPFSIFLFATLGWFIGVIEVMVAAPLIALGVMHPDGDQVLGRGEQSLLLILGIFLRPALMILGYIFGIILSYVSIWFLNAGFSIIIPDVQNMQMVDINTGTTPSNSTTSDQGVKNYNNAMTDASDSYDKGVQQLGSAITGDTSIYGMWSTIYLIFFVMLAYITSIIAVVSKSFELIHYVPDKIMRWISGGAADNMGGDIARNMKQDMKDAHKKGADASSKAMSETNAAMIGGAMSAVKQVADGAEKVAGAAANGDMEGVAEGVGDMFGFGDEKEENEKDDIDNAIDDAKNLHDNNSRNQKGQKRIKKFKARRAAKKRGNKPPKDDSKKEDNAQGGVDSADPAEGGIEPEE